MMLYVFTCIEMVFQKTFLTAVKAAYFFPCVTKAIEPKSPTGHPVLQTKTSQTPQLHENTNNVCHHDDQ